MTHPRPPLRPRVSRRLRLASALLFAFAACLRSRTTVAVRPRAPAEARDASVAADAPPPRSARDQVQNRAIFAALAGAGGMDGRFGPTSDSNDGQGPFGRLRHLRREPCSAAQRADGDCRPDDGLTQELLERDARAILGAPRRPGLAAPSPPWNRQTLTPGIRRVVDRLGLDARVLAALRRNGFAVLDRDFEFTSPYDALREIYRRELPLYVTADAILHAVFRSHESLSVLLEAPLAERFASALAAAHAALPEAARRWPREAGRDVDLYLTVARALLAGAEVAPAFDDTRAEASRLVALATGAAEFDEFSLFGRRRMIDFTSFAPRGPYAEDEARRRWFRGATWLSRIEFNVLSRDCRSSQPGITPDPSETPREAVDALALAELLARADVRETVARAEGLWSSLAGRREDVPPAELARLRAVANIARLDEPGVFERLSRAIGETYPRTARTHPMPGLVRRLPVIATVLGPRVVPDAAMTWHLVHDQIDDRFELGAADVAFALGHEPAARYLAGEFAEFPRLREGFARARTVALAPLRGDDLYGAWFEAVRSLARRPPGVLPSFMRGDAWDDLRMNSLVVGFGQLRHANVLVAASSYDGAACAIPDAYVDPTPDLYDALLDYVGRARAMVTREGDWLADSDRADLARYFDEAERTYRVLRRVVDDELAGRPLTAAQRRFVGSVVEVRPSTEGYPLHTGWYLDLFPGEEPAMKSGSFAADWYASVNRGTVSYVGVRGTRLGLFVVDRGGAPRLMVGPVALGYEHRGPLARRVGDEGAAGLPADELRAPWASSYTVTPVPTPTMSVERAEVDQDGSPIPRPIALRLTVRAERELGPLRVELLDAQGRVVARGESRVGPTPATLTVSWLPTILRAHPRSRGAEDGEREEIRHPVCGHRLRLGEWIEVSTEHPRPGARCESSPYIQINTLTRPDA